MFLRQYHRPLQFKMSAQADWNHLVVDLRNNIFKLVFFAMDCSKPAADEVLPATCKDHISGGSEGGVVAPSTYYSSSSDSSSQRRRKNPRKKVQRVPPSSASKPSPAKKKKRPSVMPTTSVLPSEDVRVIVEDVNFPDVGY
jgi:hypothetical protein